MELTSVPMTTVTIGMTSQLIRLIVASANKPTIPFSVQVAANVAGVLGNIQSLSQEQVRYQSLSRTLGL